MGHVTADVCVVGGGFAGLSAALHLAERGLDVALVEAHRVGWGASGRNGGQLGSGPRADIRHIERMADADDAAKIWDIAMAANRLVRDLVATHNIDCELTDGYLDCGSSAEDAEDLHRFAEHCTQRYGHPSIRPVSRSEMADFLGTEHYHGGALDGVAAHLHPLRLALGLARVCVRSGVRIFERSPVMRLTPTGLETCRGTVRAESRILACNGYIDGLGAKPAKVLPLNAFIAATEPLGEVRARQIIRDNVAACDTLNVLNYFRLSADHRMIWGGGESAKRRFPDNIAGVVRPRMLAVFPQLEDVAIEYAWGGTLGITATRMPVFQRTGPRVLSIGGWSGSGVHMATMGGKIAADLIAGESAAWEVLSRQRAPALPSEHLRVPLLSMALAWYRLRDRL